MGQRKERICSFAWKLTVAELILKGQVRWPLCDDRVIRFSRVVPESLGVVQGMSQSAKGMLIDFDCGFRR